MASKVQTIRFNDEIIIGGENVFLDNKDKGEFPNKCAFGLEITDIEPTDWLNSLCETIGREEIKNPVEWSKKYYINYKPDFIFINFIGTHQDKLNRSAEECIEILNEILKEISIPIIVKFSGNFEKQNQVITKCAEKAIRQIIIGSAVQENYRVPTAAALANNHYLIAESPIDVNIAKQLNILITQLNFPLSRIIIDPLTGGLGYGLEYTYSVMERIRLQLFNNDEILSSPMICFVGQETWKIKEIKDEKEKEKQIETGINWEITTAIPLIIAGANIIIVRHPQSLLKLREFIKQV
ncbi:MAG TPA: acetyl-CoA decarbonylase/synthase complex subunit delta [bacterium]|nr:acetyl-CoA decarbonylase/synthase complex subunit delta [bacterium]HOL46768.1 acetyl-CoA decarbonylase/synthase complex subunit delta [bacterium]HPQ17723.1 acetyl-CoA decarbonylase/synthase complex subunit delta [bacterium]